MPRVQVDAALFDGDNSTREDDDPDIKQYYYKPHEIQKFESDPEFLLDYRKKIEFSINAGFAIFYKDTEASVMAEKYMRGDMVRRLQNHPELTKRLIPSWPPGCR